MQKLQNETRRKAGLKIRTIFFDAVRRIIQYLGNYNVKDNGEGSHDQ